MWPGISMRLGASFAASPTVVVTTSHMVPRVVVKRRDLEPRRQRGTKLRQRLGQTQEN